MILRRRKVVPFSIETGRTVMTGQMHSNETEKCSKVATSADGGYLFK